MHEIQSSRIVSVSVSNTEEMLRRIRLSAFFVHLAASPGRGVRHGDRRGTVGSVSPVYPSTAVRVVQSVYGRYRIGKFLGPVQAGIGSAIRPFAALSVDPNLPGPALRFRAPVDPVAGIQVIGVRPSCRQSYWTSTAIFHNAVVVRFELRSPVVFVSLDEFSLGTGIRRIPVDGIHIYYRSCHAAANSRLRGIGQRGKDGNGDRFRRRQSRGSGTGERKILGGTYRHVFRSPVPASCHRFRSGPVASRNAGDHVLHLVPVELDGSPGSHGILGGSEVEYRGGIGRRIARAFGAIVRSGNDMVSRRTYRIAARAIAGISAP